MNNRKILFLYGKFIEKRLRHGTLLWFWENFYNSDFIDHLRLPLKDPSIHKNNINTT